jgi:nitrogen-specific signal transduction histidine kinase
MNTGREGAARSVPDTYFAPAERASESDIKDMSEFVAENPLFQAIEQSIDGYLMILNPQRQALAANKQLLKDLKIDSLSCLAGSRPGEILNCIHHAEGPGGCGTSKTCATCGAAISILASQNEKRTVTEECLATVAHGGQDDSLEFRVRATPMTVGGHEFTVLVFNDISGDKRRQALERTFYHDILNTLGGLMGWSSLLQTLDNLDPKAAAVRIVNLSKRLKQEIEEHRRLSQAEEGSLDVCREEVSVNDLLDGLSAIFEAHDIAKGKSVVVESPGDGASVNTDGALLSRVLTNMVKNALEAVKEGETVRVSHETRDGVHVFSVRNPGAIPTDVAARIFKRSFSTKAEKGRGIGTYSMKLFGERYLGGKVGFRTSDEEGTAFFIELPGE